MDSAPGTRVVQGETSERFKGLTFEGLVGAGRRFVPLLSSSSPSSAILPEFDFSAVCGWWWKQP